MTTKVDRLSGQASKIKSQIKKDQQRLAKHGNAATMINGH